MTSAIVKLWSLKYDHLVIIACSKMREVKSHRYVKIMNNNNGNWYFITKFSTFTQCCLSNLPVARNLIIFNNGEVTDILAYDHLTIFT